MKKGILVLALAIIAVSPMAFASNVTFSDRVVMDSFPYGFFDVSIPEGPAEGPTFIGQSNIFGFPIDVYLTEAGSNIISDHLYSPGNDDIYFASDPSLDSMIGQP